MPCMVMSPFIQTNSVSNKSDGLYFFTACRIDTPPYARFNSFRHVLRFKTGFGFTNFNDYSLLTYFSGFSNMIKLYIIFLSLSTHLLKSPIYIITQKSEYYLWYK